MSKEYVTQVNGAFRINGTRVSLDSVVYAFKSNLSPQNIVDSFPALTLEQVYGGIAFYLANQAEIDEYLNQGEIEFETLKNQLRDDNADLYKKLREHRKRKALYSRLTVSESRSLEEKPSLSPRNGRLGQSMGQEVTQSNFIDRGKHPPPLQ